MSDETRSARGRPRTMNVDKLLDTAVSEYWHGDPADISLNAICQKAGVSKPSVYREFGSEDGLTRAALDSYAERVLSDVFAILHSGSGFRKTLEALIDFASTDTRMETGCLFYKMRAGKHRLGPETRARVDALDQAAHSAYVAFLRACRETGDWSGGISDEVAARYLGEQLGLAFSQRASGEDPAQVRAGLALALSVFTQGPGDAPV